MLSDYHYVPELEGYAPALPELNGLAAAVKTDLLKIDNQERGPLELSCGLGIGALPAQAGMILFAGVRFYRNDAGVMRVMRKGGNCLGVV